MFKGIVQSGFNEGSYYVAKYSDLFESAVGFSPFPGTLNVLMNITLPHNKTTITLANFQPVDCYPILINKQYKGAIVKPHKTRHPEEVMEIIAPINLRKTLQLQDGDELECELV